MNGHPTTTQVNSQFHFPIYGQASQLIITIKKEKEKEKEKKMFFFIHKHKLHRYH